MPSEQQTFIFEDNAAERDAIAELAACVCLRAEGNVPVLVIHETFKPERPGFLVRDLLIAEMGGQERLGRHQQYGRLGAYLRARKKCQRRCITKRPFTDRHTPTWRTTSA